MKKLFLVLLFCPVFSFAQHFELGLSYGASFFTASHNNSANTVRNNDKLDPMLYSCLSLAVRLQDYDITFKIGGNRFQYHYEDGTYHRAIVASTLSEVSLSGNKHFLQRKLDVYAGATIGLLTFSNPDPDAMAVAYPDAVFVASSGAGVTGGVQVGANYPLSRRFLLNAEAGFYYAKLQVVDEYIVAFGYPSLNMDMTYLKIPVTLGVKYKFGIGKKYRYRHVRQ